jgi:hypothetical protein
MACMHRSGARLAVARPVAAVRDRVVQHAAGSLIDARPLCQSRNTRETCFLRLTSNGSRHLRFARTQT